MQFSAEMVCANKKNEVAYEKRIENEVAYEKRIVTIVLIVYFPGCV